MPKPQRKKNTLANMQADWQREANRLLIEKLGLGTLDKLDLVQAYDSNQDFKKLIIKSADPILAEFTKTLIDYRNDLKNNVEEPTITLSPQAFYYGKNALMESLNISHSPDHSVTTQLRGRPAANEEQPKKASVSSIKDPELAARVLAFQKAQDESPTSNNPFTDKNLQPQNNRAMIGMNWAA